MGLQVDVCWIPVFHNLYAHIFWQYFLISVWFMLIVKDKKQGKGETSIINNTIVFEAGVSIWEYWESGIKRAELICPQMDIKC